MTEQPRTSPTAEARQADADFGLFGGRGAQQGDDEPDEPGDQPDDIYDPAFFRI